MNTLYSISKQYHRKKGTDIWVVKLEAKIDNEDFETLKQYAKGCGGYYSSFPGVNGFVFETEQEAEDFCKELDDCLQVEETNEEPATPKSETMKIQAPNEKATVSNTENIADVKEKDFDNLCAKIGLLIKEKGTKILSDSTYKIVDILKNTDGFASLPPSVEFILRTIIMKKYGDRMLNIGKWDENCLKLIDDFVFRTGFQNHLSSLVFACMGKALSWENVVISQNKENISALPKKSNAPIIKKPSLRASNDAWSEYLTQLIVIKNNIPDDWVKVKPSVRFNKDFDELIVYVELEEMDGCNLTIAVNVSAIIYNKFGILDTGNMLMSEVINEFRVERYTFDLDTKITNIEKIVISANWHIQYEDDE